MAITTRNSSPVRRVGRPAMAKKSRPVPAKTGMSLAEARLIAADHVNELVAWDPATSWVFAFGKTISDVERQLKRAGRQLFEVVVERVKGPLPQIGSPIVPV